MRKSSLQNDGKSDARISATSGLYSSETKVNRYRRFESPLLRQRVALERDFLPNWLIVLRFRAHS